MAEASRQSVVDQISETVLSLVDGLAARLEAGIDVLDAGCGRGEALIALARRFPNSRFVGYDLCAETIAFANGAARAAGLENLRFEIRDLSDYDEKARFDFVTTFDAVHDQKDPQALIVSLRGALKPNGVYLMQDIGGAARLEDNMDFPMAPLLYAISCVHCMPVSLGQGGAGLGTMWGWETAEAMLKNAGFQRLEKHVLPTHPLNVWFVAHA
ncbi:class I SAM-dependent methyltransferase [Nitratireductor sp. GCM10026969]|uniref:class I SAM-dependent methyltransferase n=1 Tax=Nitratireductor sp. GCM10026969 TaxID=3252645 RepID=UPI003616B330